MRLIPRHLGSMLPALASLFFAASPAFALPILDGTGFGSPSATVTYDPNAPTSNFGTPGSTTSGAAYDIYTRADATFAYVLVKTNGSGGSAPGVFANLYFGTGSSASATSDVGFEVTNANVFSPGGTVSKSTAGRRDIGFSILDPGTIEFAVAFSYLETDPQGIGFTPTTAANPNIILRLSQSFGYSVAGGAASYGANRLGLIVDPIGSKPVPEPATLALLGVGLAGIGLIRRKRA